MIIAVPNTYACIYIFDKEIEDLELGTLRRAKCVPNNRMRECECFQVKRLESLNGSPYINNTYDTSKSRGSQTAAFGLSAQMGARDCAIVF